MQQQVYPGLAGGEHTLAFAAAAGLRLGGQKATNCAWLTISYTGVQKSPTRLIQTWFLNAWSADRFRRKSRYGSRGVPSLSSFEEESKMASSNQDSGNKGGSKGGNTGSSGSGSGTGTRGGTPEQHAEAGRQSHKNDGKSSGQQGGNASSGSTGGSSGGSGSSSGGSASSGGSGSSSGSTRGGTPEQHAEAGRQSHKNDDKK